MTESASDLTLLVSSRTRHLLQQLQWFNRLRWVAVLAMLVSTALGAHVFGILHRPGPLYVVALLTALLNVYYLTCFRRPSQMRFSLVRRHADLQIGLDLLVLTALLHYSGGIANPFVLFFLFHTLLAAQLHSVKAGLWVAGLSLLLVGGLGFLELYGVLRSEPTGLQFLDMAKVGTIELLVWLLAFGVTLAVAVYFLANVLQQVRTRDEELRRLNQQLGQSEKLASIGTLAAGVAHEINNPVGVIRNKAQILRYRIEDGDERAALLSELDTIERHTKRVGAITQGLLTFSKETPFALEELDINKLVLEGLELVRVPFKDAGVELDADLSEHPVRVRGSSNHLLQVLVNILINARDASAAGDTVWISTGTYDDEVYVSIRDNGSGISAEALPKIFDPFFTTKDVDRGTGLGLAISHGIVEKHRGTIQVDSQAGEGSTFRVLLPAID